jgi:hypothetical protein
VPHLNRKRALDLPQVVAFSRSSEGGSHSFGRSATGATDSMNEIFCSSWKIEVDHMSNIGHIDAARSHVGGNKHTVPALGEVAERLVPLRLRTVTVNLYGRMARARQSPGYTVGAMLGMHKNEKASLLCA